jgi:hypothetical protein
VAGKCKKILLRVKQELKLSEKFDSGESATKLAKDTE